MRSRLLAFSGLTDDAQCVLAAVQPLTLVMVELLLNILPRLRARRFELSITTFADSYHWSRRTFDHTKIALWHDCSLAQDAGRT